MNFPKEVLLLFCILFCAEICTADDELNYRNEYEACIVQYLKGKGKLNEAFQLKVAPPSTRCPVVFQQFEPNIVFNTDFDNSLQSLIMVQSIIEYPNIALCLNDKFEAKGAIDYFMKIHMLLRADNVNDTQLNKTRNKFKKMLKEIAVGCVSDDTNFIKIFNYVLGIVGETLVAQQQEYCLTKYVVDNKLLELKNVDINPHHIDHESVNCDHIVDVERNKTKKDFRDKLSAISNVKESLDSVMEAFKNHKGFDWLVALKLLNSLDIPSQVREYRNKFDEKFDRFVSSFEWYGMFSFDYK
ncbi:hypothetical protein HA402_002582 [Bradysia odoriphaga]|nr:hypothetical protein HA402_002582 [Bradysia odoriphaga]